MYNNCQTLEDTGTEVSDHYKAAECEPNIRCDIDLNTISVPTSGGFEQIVLNETPTRQATLITIPEFDYSHNDCKLLKYELIDHTAAEISLTGYTITYQTNIQEPNTILYTLKVHAEGGV